MTLSPPKDAPTTTINPDVDPDPGDTDSSISEPKADSMKPKGQNLASNQSQPQCKLLFREEQRGIWTLYYPVSERWKIPFPVLAFGWNLVKTKSALSHLWRFIREVFSLGPFALTIYLATWVVSSILPSFRLKNDSDLLDLAERALAGRIQRTEALMEFRRIVIEYIAALVVGYIVRKLKTRSSSIVERRVALHFDKRLFSVQTRLELGPSEDPAIEAKISRVTGYSSEAWTSLSSLIDIMSSMGEVIAIASILKGQLISPEGVNLFGVWALVSPLMSELHGDGDGKVFYAKVTNHSWIRMEALSQLGTYGFYKKELLSSSLEDYINSEYAQAMSKLGDLDTKNPAYMWSSDEGLFGSGMDIEFKDVSFGYPSAPNKVLNSLSFKIEPGQLCVIVGENGCGKSTTINLINRLYDCNSGEIRIDDRPIRDYKVSTLRAAANIMYQDYNHFPFTIKENILMGRPDSDNADIDIENAAKLGGAYGFIQKLPMGFETNLEPKTRGYASIACSESDREKFKSIEETDKPAKLSGGEWQRLAISRTFMKNSERTRLLCYDEPSASLDPKAEADMFERLRNLRGEKTMIFVTHRFGHLTKHADLIIYISEGSAIEQGTHKSLLAQGGEYAKMYNIQSEAFAA
ncbi:ATP-binding cassette, subfamily C, bacterial [Rhizoctonia solani]|uniref:ATP-binding cassette, subfamily C, bacterial n=1 Tax=Rhizoctonia solani TaxID=456999 RepID=A0A0K6G3W1_9AGAM|nr:ATP-binding cassette, subfamily C, bacterial [Rhizoctonia solani]